MKSASVLILCTLLVAGPLPARADFKYSDTAKITGGSLKSMMKTVGIFSKQASQAMKPITTTHYIKGNRLRTDNPDGRVQVIDLGGRRIIEIDSQKHTYTEVTFEEMKAAMQKAQDNAQKKMQEETKKQEAAGKKDPQANLNAKVSVTPGTASRQIQGLTANELKIQVDLEIQAQNDAPPSGQASGPVSGTITTNIDSWVAPSVPGYQEIGEFYKRMAKEINWVPPSNIHIDPRVSQSMDELQKNQAAFNGLPLVQYLSMSMIASQDESGNASSNGNSGGTNNSENTSSSSSTPTSASDAVVKGLGGLFSKKKKKDDAAAEQNPQNPPPPSSPGALMEMTIEVTSFSDAALDGSLFEIPAGYTRVQENSDQMFKQVK